MKKTLLMFIIGLFCMPAPALTQGLRHILPELMNRHELIKAAEDQRDAAMARFKQSKGAWYPHLDVSSEAGQEDIRKPDDSSTSELRNVQTIRGTQLVTDFGRTSGSIGQAEAELERAKTQLELTRQQVLLEGISAFLEIIKAREQLKYAVRSEENISRQTGMEETLVKRGAGVSSDVLQIKAQLAGTRARRVTTQGELILAKNRFRAVFNRYPTQEEVDGFTLPTAPFAKVPMTLEEATREALETNPALLISRHDIQASEQVLTASKGAYYPFLNLFIEGKRRENDDGTAGVRQEGRAGLELRYNLFNGGSDRAAVNAARSDIARLKNMEQNVRQMVEEQVANAWQNLLTSRENYNYLKNQTAIVEAFLNLARKERKLGTRSLLDVLNGETEFINATSMAVGANIEIYKAVYQLYHAMGKLRMDLF